MTFNVFKISLVFLLMSGFQQVDPLTYHRAYYENGTLKAEGWMQASQKENYRYEYAPNGNLKAQGPYTKNIRNGYWYFLDQNKTVLSEGHYEAGKRTGWWTVNSSDGSYQKIQYHNGNKEGVAIFYKKGTPYKAERYEAGKLKGTWTTLRAFKRDNPNYKF